jgi:imidazolonepropionase-like amidohydrolase
MRATETLCGLLLLLAATAATQAQSAYEADTVYTMAGEPLRPGTVHVRDGKIEWIGPTSAAPPLASGVEPERAKVITPGLVDAHSVVGLAGILNQGANTGGSSAVQDQDQLELSDPLQPELRAIDAYNARERLIEWVRSFGVTTMHTGHGPGALVSGQTMIVKTRGDTVDEAVVEPLTALAFTLGPAVSRRFKSPGTRAKSVAMIRAELLAARQFIEKREAGDGEDRPERNLRKEAFAKLLEGEIAALVTAQKTTDIMSALRLQKEFGFELWLDGAAESYLLIDEIREAGVPVILHPPMMRASGEGLNASFETAAKLRAAGIPFALQTGYESYVPKSRVLVFEAGIAAANGLGVEGALAAVTIDAARILGVQDRVGSLEVGKDADLVLFDDDPFEYTSHVCLVVIEGDVVSDQCR